MSSSSFRDVDWQKLIYNPPGNVWGDWSWKPARDALIPQFLMPAFPGVPKNGSELAANARHAARA